MPRSEPSTVPFKFASGSWVLHVATCNAYQIKMLPDIARLERTDEPAYGYASFEEPSVWWFRSQHEMEDGRFVPLPADYDPSSAVPASSNPNSDMPA